MLALAAIGATAAISVGLPSAASATTHRSATTHHSAHAAFESTHAVQPAAVAAGAHYAVIRHDCAAPTPGHFSCLALRKVVVPKGTPGAEPFVSKTTLTPGPAGGYTPADFEQEYGYSRNGGAGQTVALIDAYDDPNIAADLAHFDAQYGLKEFKGSFEKVGQTGKTTVLPAADTTGWVGEESLDVEAVRAVCAKCKIILVEVNNTSTTSFVAGVHAAVKLKATEISNSYGGPEENESQADDIKELEAYNHPGTIITASSGDDGWYGWDFANLSKGSDEAAYLPATLPDVTSVGGTELGVNGSNQRAEIVWNENGVFDTVGHTDAANEGASGGGCSQIYLAEGWQTHTANFAATGCKKDRSSADISADADPSSGFDVYQSYNCGTSCGTLGWATIGGTSLSSPLIASMWALAGGAHGVAYPSTSLYGNFAHNSSLVHDVTLGGNSFCGGDTTCAADAATYLGSTYDNNPNVYFGSLVDCAFPLTGAGSIANDNQCNAAPGYDGPSGIGTPNGLGIFKAVYPSAKVSKPASIKKGHKVTFKATSFKDEVPGAKLDKVVWSWGDKTKDGKGATTSHTFKKTGHFTVTMTVTDNYDTVSTKSLKVTVKK